MMREPSPSAGRMLMIVSIPTQPRLRWHDDEHDDDTRGWLMVVDL